MHFSLAHSGNVAVCKQPVGVDAEAPRTVPAEKGAITDTEGHRLAYVQTAAEPMLGYIVRACAVDMKAIEMIELQW